MSIIKHIASILALLISFSFSFSSLKTLSQSMLPIGSFFVSEINWDGSWIKESTSSQFKSNPDDEWVEFVNLSDKTIDLADYKIKGFSSSNKDLTYKDIKNCLIEPNSRLIVKRLDPSPTIQERSDCIASNMSLSNTIINFEIQDINNQTIDSSNIGNPSKLTPNKNTFKKYSIYRNEGSWVESKEAINIAQTIDPELVFQHFATPNEDGSLAAQIDIPPVLKSQIIPFELNFKLSLAGVAQSAKISVKNSILYKIECDKETEKLNDLKLFTAQKYCLRVVYTIENSTRQYQGFVDHEFDFIVDVPESPTPPIPKIVITELDLNKDQVEIYNANNIDFDLSDYYLQDTQGATKKSKMTGWIVKSMTYSVFNTKTIGITLNNNGDNLEITDSNNQKITSSAISSSKTQSKDKSWQYFNDKAVWEEYISTLGRENTRILSNEDEDVEKKETQDKTKDLLKSQNTEYFQNKLIINEISPEGEEYVEFYNQSTQEINLIGLKILDLQGKIGTLEIDKDLIVGPQNYFKIELKSKLSLNNNGDGIRLLTSTDEEIESVSYQKSQGKEKSYQRFENEWVWASITPEKPNLKDPATEVINKEVSKNGNNDKDNKNSNCSEIDIYIQTSKNIFYSNLGKVSIKNTSSKNLPSKMIVCNLKTDEDQSTADFMSWKDEIVLENLKILNNYKSPENPQFVVFNLSCKGKKTVDIIREDIIFRSVFGVKKPACVDKIVSGVGFVIKTSENYILYYTGSSKKNLNISQALIRTGGENPLSLYFEFLEDVRNWINVFLW